jgi:enoyl-CoA hydratase/carnithine racemase
MTRDGAAYSQGVVALDGGTVLFTSGQGIAEVQFNRPEKRNALTAGMIDAVHEALDLAERDGARVVVLRGSDGVFCAGADIAGYRDAADNLDELRAFTTRANEFCDRLASGPQIVVAAVDGLALGGGFELVLASDLVVASTTSQFGLPEIALGLIPGWGGTQRLARHLGPNRTKAVILTAERFGASEAGTLVTQLVEPGAVHSTALDLAAHLAARAPRALRAAKEAITASYAPVSSDGAQLEQRRLLELFASPDGIEGVRAFTEKRPAVFTGR